MQATLEMILRKATPAGILKHFCTVAAILKTSIANILTLFIRKLLAAIFFAFFARTIAKEDISRYITRYEKVRFQPISPLNAVPMKSKDSCEEGDKTCESSTVLLQVFGQSLEVRLHRAKSIFSPNAKVTMYNNGYEEVFHASDLLGTSVEGSVNEDNTSYVFGQLRNGIFDGVIRSKQETFYVERAAKYFPQGTDDFNVIVYRERDVDPCPSNVCAYDADLVNMDPLGPFHRQRGKHRLNGPHRGSTQKRRNRPFKVYDSGVVANKKMMMRNSASTSFSHAAKDIFYVCSCKMIVDYTFFETVGSADHERTISEIEVVMREAQQVFRTVDVDGDHENDTLMVIIHEIHIHRSRREPNYQLNDGAKTAHDFLESLSMYDFAGFCIGFAFTFRPFTNNILGLAYQGDPSPLRIGGACQGPVVSEARRKQHYNCGMVTMTNSRSQPIPLQMGALIVAHELAHLFGSSHDDEASEALCTPDYRHGGHYIMFSHANRGHSPNNVRLSPCSQRGILAYMTKKGHCLTCHGLDCLHRVSFNLAKHSLACSLTTPSFVILVAILVLLTLQMQW